jgi:hypothetical protein
MRLVSLALVALACAALPDALSPQGAMAQRRFDEELPEEASAGPGERARALEAARPPRPNVDYSDPDLPVYFRIGFGAGGAFESSLDDALATHGFARSPLFFVGDVSIAGRALSWLWFGGRVGAHGRGWARRDGQPAAHATGYDLLGLAHLRFQLGRVFELGGMVGAGVGFAVLVLNDHPTPGVWPRLMGGAEIGIRVARGMRVLLHGEINYFPLFDIDRYGSDLELGGGSVSLVIEVRL